MQAPPAAPASPDVLVLFDIDGTLTASRLLVEPEMQAFLHALSKKVVLGTVGGSDLAKQREQLRDDMAPFSFVNSENGMVAWRRGEMLPSTSFVDCAY